MIFFRYISSTVDDQYRLLLHFITLSLSLSLSLSSIPTASKYVPMFHNDGGVEAVQELRSRAKIPIIHELATKVLSVSEQNMSMH